MGAKEIGKSCAIDNLIWQFVWWGEAKHVLNVGASRKTIYLYTENHLLNACFKMSTWLAFKLLEFVCVIYVGEEIIAVFGDSNSLILQIYILILFLYGHCS
jgi:hypothetical protein